MVRRLSICFATILILGSIPVLAQGTAFTPIANCTPLLGVVPAGQANPSLETEPMSPIWCFNRVSEPVTRLTSGQAWADDFNTGIQMGRLDDGDMNYRVFQHAFHGDFGTELHGQMFANANHWMADLATIPNANQTRPAGALMLSPNRTFSAQNGKLVIEVDMAAMTDAMGGADNFLEIDIAAQPEPDITRDYYGYGAFTHGALGCRFQRSGPPGFPTMSLVCALFSPWPVIPLPIEETPEGGCASRLDANGNVYNCLSEHSTPDSLGDSFGNRLWESQDFECNWMGGCSPGMEDIMGNPVPGTSLHGRDFMRVCPDNTMDIYCRDRFRMEVTKTFITIFVNGGQVLQLGPLPEVMPTGPQGGCPNNCYDNPSAGLNAQIPDSLLNDASVFFTHWINDSSGTTQVSRSHWDRIAINPQSALTAAPSYCFGEPNNTCPLIFSAPGLPVPSKLNANVYDFLYDPQTINVSVGDTVTWTNVGRQDHTVTSNDLVFNSGTMPPDGKYHLKFLTPGSFNYFCTIHPGMTGIVNVYGANSSTVVVPSPTPAPPTPTGVITPRPTNTPLPPATATALVATATAIVVQATATAIVQPPTATPTPTRLCQTLAGTFPNGQTFSLTVCD